MEVVPLASDILNARVKTGSHSFGVVDPFRDECDVDTGMYSVRKSFSEADGRIKNLSFKRADSPFRIVIIDDGNLTKVHRKNIEAQGTDIRQFLSESAINNAN